VSSSAPGCAQIMADEQGTAVVYESKEAKKAAKKARK
jgi:hypothetical protein